MNTLSFTISTGNNPVPYKRTTQRQKYVCKEYKKYNDYKSAIIRDFTKVYKKPPSLILEKDRKYYLDITIFYKDKTHGDSDNVFKGIADALFQKPLNDKYIAGSFDFFYDKANPRVEVEIFEDDKIWHYRTTRSIK